MSGGRKFQVAAALFLGVALPCLVTILFLRVLLAKQQPIVGEKAPDFLVTCTSGDVRTLNYYKNRRLVLGFVDLDCQACQDQLGFLDELSSELSDTGLAVLAISESGSERTIAFCSEFGLSFDLAVDPGALRKDYYVDSTPMIVLVDEKGVVRFRRGGAVAFRALSRLLHAFAREGKIPLGQAVRSGPDG